MTLIAHDAERMQHCLATGGVVVFPTDTVYGVGCDPENAEAVRRLYELKGRPAARAAAVMFFTLPHAFQALPDLGARERRALAALLPGPLTVVLPNPSRRFPLACAPVPGEGDSLGLRVPFLDDPFAVLHGVSVPLLQSSANISGETEARRLADVAPRLMDGADLVLDGGELAGVASTVLDLRSYERSGDWRILRAGPVQSAALELALAGC